MKFNTAIFYDVENLLKGYGFSQRIIQGLSLKEIFQKIKETEAIGKVAIQRAYANWSDPRLGFMRNELLDLGIEPIQVFGFSTGGNKNVADIQLAVEVTDLLHTHPTLENFVIVSGDGGYASVAKKLHEYGKTVIGCAYEKTANHVLAAVCDHFVWIEDPENNGEDGANVRPTDIQASDPRVQRMRRSIQSIPVSEGQDAVLKKIKEIFDWTISDNEFSSDLRISGVSPSVLRDAINVSITGFDPIKFGFPKFLDFLRFVAKGTVLGIWQSKKNVSDVKVGFKKHAIRDHVLLPDLEPREIHSPECYKSVLAHGTPMFKLPQYESLKEVAIIIQENEISSLLFGEMIDLISNAGSFGLEQENIKLALSCFISANCFLREPESAKLFEQRFTLDKKQFNSYEALLEHLKSELKKKISLVLGDYNPDVFEETLK